MKHILTILLPLSILFASANHFKKHQTVQWSEVNLNGQKFTQTGLVISRKGSVYRVLSRDGWKMHLHENLLTGLKK